MHSCFQPLKPLASHVTHARVQAFVQVVGNVWVKEVQMTNQIGVLQQQDPFMSNKQAGSTHVNQPNRLQSTGKSS